MAGRLVFVLSSAAFVAAMVSCAAPVVPPSIPPPAASVPLDLDEDAFESFEEEPSAPPRAACETPPPHGVASPDFTATRRYIEQMMRWTGAPSVAVAVARGGEILWEEGFGYADPRRRTKATEHTMYSLASISKPFTATGIMVLREQGKLALDQPISELLPAPGLGPGVGDPAKATIERVASHTAGLGLHYQFYYEDRDARVPTLEQTRRNYAYTVAEPGERYQYSNLGFGLLGQVIEHVSGTPYPEFMKTQVFEPLDLHHTFVGRPPRGAGVEAVRVDGRGKAIPYYGFDHDGASAVYSSAHDLVRFGMFHAGTKQAAQDDILSEQARERMRDRVPPADYGLGWGLGRDDAVMRISHGGGMPGVRTALQVFPEQGVVIVVLVNSSTIGRAHVDIANEIRDALGMPARADSVCMLPLDHDLFGSWTGELKTVGGMRPMTIEVRPSGEIMAAFGEGPPSIVRNGSFEEGTLSGIAWAEVGAELGEGRPSPMRIRLALRDGQLQGGVSPMLPWTAATTGLAVLSPTP